jgi:serine protease Do
VDHCPRCGSAVSLLASQCPHCGLSRQESPDDAGPATRRFVPYFPPEPPRRRVGAVAAAVVSGLLVVMLAATGALWVSGTGPFHGRSGATDPGAPDAPSGSPSASPSATTAPSSAASGDFTHVYARVKSGVGLVTVQTCDGSVTGTGFMVGPTTMVTAAHVVAGAVRLSVSFGATSVGATVTGVDGSIDLAVLRLARGSGSRHVFALAPHDPRPGTAIAVIGYPFDEPKSLTQGTISGLGRSISTDSGTFDGLIQTDAAINPGNSGGPLLDAQGQVVGLADAIRRHAQGIGFAVPISEARDGVVSGAGLRTPAVASCAAPAPQAPQQSVTDGVTQTLLRYTAAINARDYEGAMSLVSSTIRSQNPSSSWYSNYATTSDDLVAVQSVAATGTTAHVWATFRSVQAVGYGPVGAEDATCLIWSIDYTMTLESGTWIIEHVSGHSSPPWVRCD